MGRLRISSHICSTRLFMHRFKTSGSCRVIQNPVTVLSLEGRKAKQMQSGVSGTHGTNAPAQRLDYNGG